MTRMNSDFRQYRRWGEVCVGTVVTDYADETYVIKNNPQSILVVLLSIKGGLPVRFEIEDAINHGEWRSGVNYFTRLST